MLDVFANISNEGLSSSDGSFIVQFFRGHPSSGVQLGGNITVSNLEPGQSIVVNTSYTLQAGLNNIFVSVDPDDEAGDIDLSNNVANNSLSVELYQYYHGNVSVDFVLGSDVGSLFVDYPNITGVSGHILVAHSNANFAYEDLQALTRNIDGNFVSGDFDNLDQALNSSGFSDSIRKVWGGDSNVPIQTRSFNLSSGTISDVPIVNSTDNSNFVTGILWDTSDDTGNERYDPLDRETIVFITEINPQSVGRYGTYDYEIRVPALLRDYETESTSLAFYVEII